MANTLHHGDCLAVLPTLASESVDSIVTDPPAGIAFMGKQWDKFGAGKAADGQAARDEYREGEAGRPGFAFSGKPLTPRRGERDAFISFLTPVMAECLRIARPGSYALVWAIPRTSHWTATAMEDAGWVIQDCVTHLFGTGFPKHKSKLKPGAEFWWLGWKPAKKATPLQIDACRLEPSGESRDRVGEPSQERRYTEAGATNFASKPGTRGGSHQGRWPANVTLDEAAAVMLDEQAGTLTSGKAAPGGHRRNTDKFRNTYSAFAGQGEEAATLYGDTGGASRFYYVAKASKSDRGDDNTHPTVKSTALMRWLCRLITPPGGRVLDPFAGSGTTLVACQEEGFEAVGIEREAEYVEIIKRRLAGNGGSLFSGVA